MRALLFTFLIAFPVFLKAQVFKAGITAGPTFSQIEGDVVAGFYKVGFQAGVVSDVYINDQFSWGIEILYSKRGSASAFNPTTTDGDFRIRMDYVEVPLIFKYNDKNKMTGYVGVSFNRLLTAELIDQFDNVDLAFFEDPINPTKKTDIQGIIGFSYATSPVFNLGVRWNRGITYFRQFFESNYRNQGMYHSSVTLRAEFIFSALREN